MTPVERGALAALQAWGFAAEKIPESDIPGVRSPDFKVTEAGATHFIEVKEREDDPSHATQKRETLARGELFPEHMPLIRRNTVSGIIRDASAQLASVSDPRAFRLAWLIASDDSQEAKVEQFEAALYGTTRVFDLDSAEGHRPCYFFRNSDFYRYRDILDGAIVSTLESAKLCMNPLSTRYGAFKGTRLYAHFGQAISDPNAEEAAGYAYIIDSDLDRANEEAVMNFLRAKHNSPRLMNIDLGYLAATVAHRVT